MAETNSGIRAKVQKFGSYLSGMIMPNIGAFIAWGIITALFIPEGPIPNDTLGALVDPMVNYLLPLLIAFSGGRLVHGFRGGVVGATSAMGLIAGADIPMFLGAMIIGPLSGYLMKKIDELFQDKIRQGFEMLYNNFSAGILAAIIAGLSAFSIGPLVNGLTNLLSSGIQIILDYGLTPLASIIIEPAKILFLNNAINHGILSPIGVDQSSEFGKSILFLLEANPGPGFGILLAFSIFGTGASKSSAPGAAIIQFLGGIHEIYFPYVLAKPSLIIAAIASGVSGIFTFQLLGAGLVAPASPGSIIAVFLMGETSVENYIGLGVGVIVSTAVSFVIGAFILKTSKEKETDISGATDKMESMKGKESSVASVVKDGGSETEGQAPAPAVTVEKVVFACDAGMGSSAMGASLLKKKFKEADLDIFVTNKAINDIPDDADIVITHKDLTDRAKAKIPAAEHISVENFLNSPKYDELVSRLTGEEAVPETEPKTPAETPKEEVEKVIFACDAGMGSSAMGASLLKKKFKEAGLDIFVTNKAINDIPDDADIVITHKDLTDRAKAKIPAAEHISVENFLNSPKYDELVDRLQ